MANKKNLDALLNEETTPPPIRRGQGVRLSGDAETQERMSAETQKRRNAETQDKPKRVNRGYMLREDLIKFCRLLAVNEGRNLYEIMEDALEEYLNRRNAAPPQK